MGGATSLILNVFMIKELEVENSDLETRRKIGAGRKVWEFRQSSK